MKTEALGDRLTRRLAEVKVKTLVTFLSEIRACALFDTLADRLTDVEIKTLAKTVARRFSEVLMKQLA